MDNKEIFEKFIASFTSKIVQKLIAEERMRVIQKQIDSYPVKPLVKCQTEPGWATHSMYKFFQCSKNHRVITITQRNPAWQFRFNFINKAGFIVMAVQTPKPATSHTVLESLSDGVEILKDRGFTIESTVGDFIGYYSRLGDGLAPNGYQKPYVRPFVEPE